MRPTCGPTEKAMRAAPLASDRPAPHRFERGKHVASGRALDDHRGVAPARAVRFEDPCRPFASNAHAAGDADALVDDEELPVISRDKTEPGTEPGLVEDLNVDSGARDLSNE